MLFALTLAVTIALSAALREPLRRWPWAFYALAAAAVLVLLAVPQQALPKEASLAMLPLVKKGYVATALFVVVMFVGALPRGGRVDRWMRPVRAQLSIVACILIAGHVIGYLASYLPRLTSGAISGTAVYLGLAAAVVLTALTAVLGVTSLQRVKRAMAPGTWKRVQRLAYLFTALLYVHALLMLLPSALSGGAAAQESAAAYTVVFAAYLVARLARAWADRSRDAQTIEEAAPDGDAQALGA